MKRVAIAAAFFTAVGGFILPSADGAEKAPYVVTPATSRAIEEAAPERPLVKPARPRKVLVYGRLPTHPESVACCFKAMEILSRKTGAFEALPSGDPSVFLPKSLSRFDAVVMNNTHERSPMLPRDFDQLPEDEKKTAKEREEVLKRSLLDFVASGKGIVGIHGAVAGLRWPEYLELMAGCYGGHFTDSVWVKPEDAAHPLCAPLKGRGFEVRDEIYMFREPYAREKVRVLLSLDLDKTKDPGKRDDKHYAVSWVRPYGKGRVFYCSLGHFASAYRIPEVLEHYLAGIQFAVGDLEADATP